MLNRCTCGEKRPPTEQLLRRGRRVHVWLRCVGCGREWDYWRDVDDCDPDEPVSSAEVLDVHEKLRRSELRIEDLL